MSQLVVYVLSDRSNTGKYKVGSHTGTLSKLKSRYITAIPDLEIHYFVETSNAKYIEDRFKEIHRSDRFTNSNGNLSEWFILPLDQIISTLLAIINKHQIISSLGTTIISVDSNLNLTETVNTNIEKQLIVRSSLEPEKRKYVTKKDSGDAYSTQLQLSNILGQNLAKISYLENQLSIRDIQISGSEQLMKSKDDNYSLLKSFIDNRNNAITHLNHSISGKDSTISRLNQSIAEKEIIISQLQFKIAASERLKCRQDDTITDLNRLIHTKNDTISHNQQDILHRNDIIHTLCSIPISSRLNV